MVSVPSTVFVLAARSQIGNSAEARRGFLLRGMRERERERERALWERERETTYDAAHTAVLPCLGLRPPARGSA
jgi:hypothetical protein